MPPTSQRLCRKCKKRPRVSLYFCRRCLDEHNAQTRELKRKYRREGKCVMCAEPTKGTRRCPKCQKLQNEYTKNSLFLQSKKAKQGTFGGIKQISEVL